MESVAKKIIREEHDPEMIEKFLMTFSKVGMNKNVVFNYGEYKLFAKTSETKYSHEVWGYDGDIPDEWNEFKMFHKIILQKECAPFEIDIELTSQDTFYGRQDGPVITSCIWNKFVEKGHGRRLSNETLALILDILSGSERENEKIEELAKRLKNSNSEYYEGL